MLTFLQGLRPDANLTCICPEPDKVRQDYRVFALLDRPSSTDFNAFVRRLNRRLHILGWIYTIRQVRKLDLLIIPGNTFSLHFRVVRERPTRIGPAQVKSAKRVPTRRLEKLEALL